MCRLTLASISECRSHLRAAGQPQGSLKEKEGEVADLCRGMEELSAARKATTEEISWLKADLATRWWFARVEKRSWCSLGGSGEEVLEDAK